MSIEARTAHPDSLPPLRPAPRAPYASDPERSRGRLYPVGPSPTRTAYQRDRDRIIHSKAFRRLKHKTQVFLFHEGDHYRTRLTHSLEVSQVARSLARALQLDEDLAESLALAHDLGHPPYGHAGEDALRECMAAFGGFDHNAQSLRIVTRLERRYAEYDGLNLTWETLEGIVKHNGPLLDRQGRPLGPRAETGLPHAVRAYSKLQDLRLDTHASLEAQAAAIADDIAYDAHDVDDGLRAGAFSIEELHEVPFLAAILAEIRARYPALERPRLDHELFRRIITYLIEDVIAVSARNLAEAAPASPDEVRLAGRPLVGFSAEMAGHDRALKTFLLARVYRHPRVMRIRTEAKQVLRNLFERFMTEPALLPESWRIGLEPGDEPHLARRVCDYIAGMTDGFALDEHRRLFDAAPDLR